MKYTLNEKSVILKKIKATERDQDVDIQLKGGTLVLTFAPGAFELYKHAIYEYYSNSATKTYEKIAKSSNPIKKAIVEESLSMKHKQGVDQRQLYRINIFNTTSVINVNGRHFQNFICDDLPNIINLVNLNEVRCLNEKIKDFCTSILENQINPSYKNTITTRSSRKGKNEEDCNTDPKLAMCAIETNAK